MIARLKAFINANNMIQNGAAVIAGVSGGPDSMALLDVLCGLRGELGFSVIAAHLNHGLRPEADAEQELVRRRCEDYGVMLHCRRVEVRELAQRNGWSLEDAGRQARYGFFRELKAETGAAAIATAHHSGDRAESVLLHLLRGSGIRGLRGILPVNGDLIRPLLIVSRADIMAYVEEKRLPYCIDDSNYDLAYTRNRIRHQLLPLLREQYNPSVDDALNRLAEVAAEDEALLEALSRSALAGIVTAGGEGEMVLERNALYELPCALQRRVLLVALKDNFPGEWGLEAVARLRELGTKNGSSHRVVLNKAVTARLEYGRMIIGGAPAAAEPFGVEIAAPGPVALPDGRCWELYRSVKAHWQRAPGELALDYERLQWPLCLRSRRPGDRFEPPGMTGSKKLKDVLMEAKIPQSQRDAAPLLASLVTGEIYALPGRGAARNAAVNAATRELLVIRAVRGENFGVAH
ncbi:MAG: tRNA lysidine(34) synthetase TilS [Syntrophomonadaceae bacterium]|nr:tRNA lysidine(34) synthetase TilS [Syntrophomonadaceae bacterium]